MIIFGLTGGIGSGKSTVSKIFRDHDIPMVDADLVARKVVEPGSLGLSLLIEVFGKNFLKTDGSLDRVIFGRFVFANPLALKILNEIMIPLIKTESIRQFKNLKKVGYQLAGFDAALIIEQGDADNYRPLIVVACSKELQISRLIKRNGLTYNEALARVKSQLPVEEKIKVADFIIDSSQDKNSGEQQTLKAIAFLKDINERKN